METVVLALGGNALQENKSEATAKAQLAVVERTAVHVANIIESGYRVVVAHGNGPQVGRILLQNERAIDITPAMPLDVCGAMSQGMIGYQIQQGLSKALRARSIDTPVATVVTQVVVDPDDAAFSDPTKPIGPFYTEAEAKRLAETRGFAVREDSGRGWRRVVPSPQPLAIVELPVIRALTESGCIVVTVGGGGIPVVRDGNGDLMGVSAVVDKDLASARLAEDIEADVLLILTAIDQVCLHYGEPNEERLSSITVEECARYIAEGHFAPGSMLPKMQAAMDFAASKPGRRAVITSLDKTVAALSGSAGTTVCG